MLAVPLRMSGSVCPQDSPEHEQSRGIYSLTTRDKRALFYNTNI